MKALSAPVRGHLGPGESSVQVEEGTPFPASLSPAKPVFPTEPPGGVFAPFHHEEGGTHGLSGGREGCCLPRVIPCSREPVAQSGPGDWGSSSKAF